MMLFMNSSIFARYLRAATTLAIVDGLFACVLTLAYGRSVAKLWQGVASAPFGPGMLERGNEGVAIGVLTHIGVAFFWTAVFMVLLSQSTWLQQLLDSPGGYLKIAAVYGPMIWIIMSQVVVPIMATRAPITWRWWVQLAGHFFFVGIPVTWSLRRRA